MPRRMKTPRHPRAFTTEIANGHPDGMVERAEVEWPAVKDATSSFGGFVHVIQDRIRPRHFTTLGHHFLIEDPQTGGLCGDKTGFQNQRHYNEMIASFIQMTLERLDDIEAKLIAIQLPAQEDIETG